MLSTATAPPPKRKRRSASSSTSNRIKTTTNRLAILGASVLCLGSLSIVPIMILERLEHHSVTDASHHSVDNVVRKQPHEAAAGIHPPVIQDLRKHQGKQVIQKPNVHHITDLHEEHHDAKILTPRDRHPTPKLSLKDLSTDEGHRKRPVARGVAGLPLDQTPAVVGAQRAHIHCDINVDSVAYWNDPQGTRDGNFVSPFSVHQERYITFTSDRGGWNNVRMSMEIIFILAAATNRTLVLPPKEPLYLLAKGKERHKGFADFFPLTTPAFQKKVRTITTLEFLEREGPEGTGRLQLGEHAESIMAAAEFCDFRAASEHSCGPLREFLNHAGTTVNVSATRSCIVFDEGVYSNNSAVDPASLQNLKAHCGTSRELHYWQASRYEDPLVLHFPAGEREYRLLAHFYGSIYFTNPSIDHYYKRFVRDFLHYHDAIWCAAGKIVKALQVEASRRGFQPNDEGAGGYSALHVRRGDLQYKKVKIPAQEWYDNTKHVWLKNELLYVATDERNKSFFDDLAVHHDLRYLDDYWELANLSSLDGNYMGMIDTIVASRGRAFAGTWFSTFSGYINRMRGYHGLSMKDSWYSFLPKANETHEWPIVDSPKYAYEWPDGWIEIDGDTPPTKQKF